MTTTEQTPSLHKPLKARQVARELNLSIRTFARDVGLSAGALHTLLSVDAWPKRANKALLQDRIQTVLKDAGATELQLVGLFERYDPFSDLKRRAAEKAATRAARNQSQPVEDEPMLIAKQSLSPEARKAFALFSNPFDGEVTRAEEMFQNGEIRYVREACWQAAINGRFVAVVGESGAGKTTVLGDLEERIQRDHKPVSVIRPSVLAMEDSDRTGKTLKAGDIISAVILTLDPYATVRRGMEPRTRDMARLVEESAKVGNSHLLVIEEAHSLPIPTLKHLKRLHEHLRIGRKPALGILLLGQPELAGKLSERRHDVREVVQRCEVVQLMPLDGDLRNYLDHRTRAAGRELTEFITDDGIDELRNRLTVTRASAGREAVISLLYPLAVNNFMTACLNLAAELGSPKVNRDVVRAV